MATEMESLPGSIIAPPAWRGGAGGGGGGYSAGGVPGSGFGSGVGGAPSNPRRGPAGIGTIGSGTLDGGSGVPSTSIV